MEGCAMAEGYKTRQRAVILELLKVHIGEHLTADEIATLLERYGRPVGKATVYRCLERLIAQGSVKKYQFGEGKSACFEYQSGIQPPHYHLKCAHCGALTHLECGYLDKLPEHVYKEHGFELDAAQIVLVGCCAQCAEKRRTQQEEKNSDEKSKKAEDPQGDE
jgi:Fur family ferric uptake transcriptional regulator